MDWLVASQVLVGASLCAFGVFLVWLCTGRKADGQMMMMLLPVFLMTLIVVGAAIMLQGLGVL